VVKTLAWCGAALSCLLSLPQAIRVLRAERLDGISALTYWIVLINAAVWAAWSLLTGEYAAGAPALINGPAAILILRRLIVVRRKRRMSRRWNLCCRARAIMRMREARRQTGAPPRAARSWRSLAGRSGRKRELVGGAVT
jgi:uncharacterized protein with PQ loop repeat